MRGAFEPPPEPQGSGPYWTFAKWVWRMLNLPFVDTPTIKWSVSTRGVSARAIVPPGGGSPGTPVNVQQFVMMNPATQGAIQSDFILCYKYGDA